MEQNNVIEVWDACLKRFEALIEPKAFGTWFLPIKPLRLDGASLTVQVPSAFFCEYIEAKFMAEIRLVLPEVLGKEAKLHYQAVVDSSSSNTSSGSISSTSSLKGEFSKSEAILEKEQKVLPNTWQTHLIPQLFFDKFCQGESNQVPVALAQTICESPGNPSMNPFFLYGPPGVGKTHLMNAIGWTIAQKYPEKRVLYISTSQFLDQFAAASRNHKVGDFMRYYQQVDVLLIDDIQGLAGKEKTQDAFFDIFNHLFNLQKQIVMTCDKAPSFLSGMHERLVSRIKGSLSTEISRPDPQLRRKILEYKMDIEGVSLSKEVLDFVVKHVDGNVRELHGVLTSLVFNAAVTGREISLPYAQEIVRQTVRIEDREVNIERIQKIVCDLLHVNLQDLQSKSRRQDIVQARHLVMFLSKKYTTDSLSAIGETLGGRSHATVLHGCQTVSNTISINPQFASTVANIESQLRV